MTDREKAIRYFQQSVDSAPIVRLSAIKEHVDACETALAALRAEEEREKGCEYCTVNKELAETLQVDTLCAAFTKHTSEMKCLCRPLRYCPMCGRKLDGGGQDEPKGH